MRGWREWNGKNYYGKMREWKEVKKWSAKSCSSRWKVWWQKTPLNRVSNQRYVSRTTSENVLLEQDSENVLLEQDSSFTLILTSSKTYL